MDGESIREKVLWGEVKVDQNTGEQQTVGMIKVKKALDKGTKH